MGSEPESAPGVLRGMNRRTFSRATIALAVLSAGCSGGGSGGSPPDTGAQAPAGEAGPRAAGQGGDTAPARPPMSGQAPSVPPGVTDNLVPLDSLDDLPYLMLDEHRIDVDGDGRAESVELWVDATRDARGRLRLDDGQRWALVVRTNERIYRLFDEFVQLGQPRFMIIAPDDGGLPIIALLLDQSAGLLVQTFRWQPARGGFERQTPVRLTGNRVYESPPH